MKFGDWGRLTMYGGFIGLFGLMVWQLWPLTPKTYCMSVFGTAASVELTASGARYYVTCVLRLLDTKTYVIMGLLAIVGIFIVAHVVRELKIIASVRGPGGIGGSIGLAESPVPVTVENPPEQPVPVAPQGRE